MNGFTARWILACWPRLDLVVNRAPHCPQMCGFVSSNDELRRLRGFGDCAAIATTAAAEEDVGKEAPPFAAAADVDDVTEPAAAVMMTGFNRNGSLAFVDLNN